MSIHFIPNDPLAGAGAPPLRRKKPTKDRPAGRAGFKLFDPEPEGLHPPGSPEFLFWQCREAALLAVLTWERHAGRLRVWQGKRRRLDLVQDAVRQLGRPPQPNAFYDRSGFLFFESTAAGQTTLAGASTDVVAHEVGHGLLDAIRPDLWDTPFLEVNAFHEAFGDCVALLTALGDPRTRTALLKIGLGKRNFVETTAEELSAAIRRTRSHPQRGRSAPRPEHADLAAAHDPAHGRRSRGPHQREPQLRPGLHGLLLGPAAQPAGLTTTSAALEAATRTAATLLIRGTATAPEEARFFQSVGRAMTLADDRGQRGRAPLGHPRRVRGPRHRPRQQRDAGTGGGPGRTVTLGRTGAAAPVALGRRPDAT